MLADPTAPRLVKTFRLLCEHQFGQHLYHHMTAAQALIKRLELAGIPCKEFEDSLQQACANDSCTAVLEWLTTQATDNLLSDRQAALMQRSDTEDHQRPPTSPDLDPLIIAVQKEEQSKSMLQACLSEDELQEAIIEQEAKLLKFKAKLKSLQALSLLISKQTPAAKPLQAAAAHQTVQAKCRHDTNQNRLQSQQDALNTLLQEINQTIAGLQANFSPQHMSWLLSLSNLHMLHQTDAAFQQEMDRSVHCCHLYLCYSPQTAHPRRLYQSRCICSLYKKQFQTGPAADMHEEHASAQWLEGLNPLQADSLHNILRGPNMQVQ